MENLLKLTDQERATLFNEAAARTGLPSQAIEKDWWVTSTLRAVFASKHAPHLIFKGGTSLR